MAFKDYRTESKSTWGTNSDTITIEQLQTGALLRIADASELMAKEHASLVRAKKWAEERSDRLSADNARLLKSNAALRGHIKRLKNK